MMLRIEDDMKRDLVVRGRAEARRVARAERHVQRGGARLRAARSSGAPTTASCRPTSSRSSRASAARRTRSVDAICDLSPDLVIANQEENTKSDLEALAQRGVKVLVAFPKRAADGLAHLARLARIFRVERDPAVRALLKRGYEVIREAEERARAARSAAHVLSDLDGPADDDPRRHVHQRHARSRGRAERLRRSRSVAIRSPPISARPGRSRRRRRAGRDTRYPRVTLDEVVARAPELVLLPDEPHPFTEEDAEVFRALAIPAAARGAVVRTGGKDLCWYGAQTIEGLPRLRALVDRFRRQERAARELTLSARTPAPTSAHDAVNDDRVAERAAGPLARTTQPRSALGAAMPWNETGAPKPAYGESTCAPTTSAAAVTARCVPSASVRVRGDREEARAREQLRHRR